MSVVRATTGTRINEDGLVELVPYNYIQYSELFSDASWTKTDSNIVGGFISPTGDANASKLSVTAANGIIQKPVSLTDLRTVSIYAKRGTHQYLRFGAYGGTNSYGNFDLENGVITSGANTQIEDVGNGWYRCTCHSANGTTGGVQIFSSNSPSGAATTAGDIYIWGAQANEGSSALDYLPTTDRLDVARIDYSSGSGALLVEPQRTNLALYSSSFESGFWAKINSTITANTIVSPSGIQDADTLTSTSTIDENQVRFGTFSILGNVGSSYTTSVYAKKGTANYLRIRNLFVNNGGSDGNAWFNLTNGTTGTIQSSQIATIEDAGNGWWRCSLTGVVGSSSSFNFIDIGFADADNDYIPSTIINGYIWGAQLEVGSYPTSYIPTTSASVTRNADVISKTGISSLIGQTEGTLFVDLEDFIELDIPCLTIDNGTNDNRIVLYREFGTGYLGLFLAASGTIVTALSTTSASDGKIAIAYTGTTFVMYRNGVQIVSTTSAIPSSMSAVRFNGRATNDFYTTRKIKSFALWKTRLTNTQLAELTTL
jgi:hypothetical protein